MRYNSLVVFALLSTPAVAFFAPNHHHAIAPIATGRVRPIRMAAEEFAEATKLALNSAPLYLAPVAALGAAQQASAQKKKLEREVAVTEEELKEIRKRLKTTDQQINTSFGLAVISAGLVASNVLGGSTNLQSTVSSLPSSTVAVEEPKEVLALTPSQERIAKRVEEREEAESPKPAAPAVPEAAATPDSFATLMKKIESTGEAVGQDIAAKTEAAVEGVAAWVDEVAPIAAEEAVPEKADIEGVKPDIEAVKSDSVEPSTVEKVEAAIATTVETTTQNVENAVEKAASAITAAADTVSTTITAAADTVAKEAAPAATSDAITQFTLEPSLNSGFAVDLPDFSLPKISIPAIDNVNPQVLEAAGVFAVGAVIAAGLISSSGSSNVVSSTMPPGTKSKGSTYLGGLARASSTLANKRGPPASYLDTLKSSRSTLSSSGGSRASNSYLDTLVSASSQKATPFTAKKSVTASTGGSRLSNSYLENLKSASGTSSRGSPFSFSKSAAVAPPSTSVPISAVSLKAEQKTSKVLDFKKITDTEKPVVSIKVNDSNVKSSSGTGEVAAAGPGLSYLSSIASVASKPIVKAPFKAPYNPKTSSQPKLSSSYLDNIAAIAASTSTTSYAPYGANPVATNVDATSTSVEASSGTREVATPGPGLSNLSNIAPIASKPTVKAPFKAPYNPKTSSQPKMSTSYLDNIATIAAPTTSYAPYGASVPVETKVGAASSYVEASSGTGPGLSYLSNITPIASKPTVKAPFKAPYNPKTSNQPKSSSTYLENIAATAVDSTKTTSYASYGAKLPVATEVKVNGSNGEALSRTGEVATTGSGLSYLSNIAPVASKPTVKAPFTAPYNPRTSRLPKSSSPYLENIAAATRSYAPANPAGTAPKTLTSYELDSVSGTTTSSSATSFYHESAAAGAAFVTPSSVSTPVNGNAASNGSSPSPTPLQSPTPNGSNLSVLASGPVSASYTTLRSNLSVATEYGSSASIVMPKAVKTGSYLDNL